MTDRIAMLEAREKPDAAKIIDEVRASLQNAQSMGVFEKIAECHNIRRCLWANQAADGLKHGDDAFPWDRALDYKARTAERIIADNVRIRMAAVRSGTVQIGPENEFEDDAKAQTWDRVLKFYRNKGKRMMRNEMRLFFNCVEEFGYGIMHVDWHEHKRLLPQKITLDALASFLVQSQLEQMAAAGDQPDEAMIQSIVETTGITIEEALTDTDRAALVQMIKAFDPEIVTSEALKVCTGLKKGTKEVEYFAPRSLGGLPCVKALIPWVNCLHGMELTESGWNTWMAIPSWKTEVEIRLCAEMEEWNPAVVERVLQYPNRGLMEMINQSNLIPDWVLNGTGMGLAPDRQSQYRQPMYQVLCVYRIALNEAGVPAIYETTVSPNVPDAVLGHECEPIKVMPFVVEARESAGLIVQSRGIPELVQGDQIATKKMMDGSVAAGELSSFPPSLSFAGDDQQVKPGSQIVVNRQTGTVGAQAIERFQRVPGVDMGALQLMRFIKEELNETFHRGTTADPDMRQMMIDEMGESAVLTFEEIVKVIWEHIQAYVSNVTAGRIAGRPVKLQATEEDLMGEADINVQFSALALNKKAAGELAEWMTKMAPLDHAQRYNMGKVVETITRLYDPTLADTIVEPAEVAAGHVDDEEQSDLAKLASGQLPPVRQGGYQQRMQKIQEWLSNPAVQQQMANDSTLAARVQQRWDAYVQQGITQPRNAMVGRIGYDPSKDPVLGQNEVPQMPGAMQQPAAA